MLPSYEGSCSFPLGVLQIFLVVISSHLKQPKGPAPLPQLSCQTDTLRSPGENKESSVKSSTVTKRREAENKHQTMALSVDNLGRLYTTWTDHFVVAPLSGSIKTSRAYKAHVSLYSCSSAVQLEGFTSRSLISQDLQEPRS